ncbi:hypothetical protein SAMN04487911_10614 [Arenibacter nanhaiticus]|uniref:Uncharacterized protein n=1 Tax=Arenibacter nanhaiticus TaxID=558155 RepID=A0A1M6E3Z0_9FLAO|nr:hypothetical protein [Arenibacter nanhaiticus]SHI80212.1 hypothetical protein SAMN04487911_10614 [Arenibacter nanhaiticus]
MDSFQATNKQPLNISLIYTTLDDWMSDLTQHKEELIVLQLLLDRYFSNSSENENLDDVRQVLIRFESLRIKCDKLIQKIEYRKFELACIPYFAPKETALEIIKKQLKLKKTMYDITEAFKLAKKDIFKITAPTLLNFKTT